MWTQMASAPKLCTTLRAATSGWTATWCVRRRTASSNSTSSPTCGALWEDDPGRKPTRHHEGSSTLTPPPSTCPSEMIPTRANAKAAQLSACQKARSRPNCAVRYKGVRGGFPPNVGSVFPPNCVSSCIALFLACFLACIVSRPSSILFAHVS